MSARDRVIRCLEAAALKAAAQVFSGLHRKSEHASVLMWLQALKGPAR